MKRERIVRKALSIAFFLITIAVLWVTHRAVHFMMDDLWYSTLLYSEDAISSWKDIWNSQVWHYHNWGGRSIAHGILQFILWNGELFADICNVLFTVLLAVMVCKMANKLSITYVSIAMGLFHGLNPNWLLSMYWQSGSCNYVYMTVIILAFLYLYIRAWREPERKDLKGIYLYIIPLGLCAGWSNENMGPAIWILTIIVMLWLSKQKYGVKLWMILGNLSCLIGSILLIVAPGNMVRAQEATTEYGFLWTCFLRCFYESRGFFEYLFLAIVVAAVIVLINTCILNLCVEKTDKLLLFGAVLSWGAMVLSPHYPDRASFGTMILLICVILSQAKLLLSHAKDKKAYYAVGAIGGILWLRGMYLLGAYLASLWGWIR